MFSMETSEEQNFIHNYIVKKQTKNRHKVIFLIYFNIGLKTALKTFLDVKIE